MTNKDLYIRALAKYTCNAYEVEEQVYDNDDWSEVILWEPFENWEIEDVKELVDDLYEEFLNLYHTPSGC